MKRYFLLFWGLLALVYSVNAKVEVQSVADELIFTNADYEVHFTKENGAWSLVTLQYKGEDIILNTTSNGPGLLYKDIEKTHRKVFIGSQNGGEKIHRAVVMIDGKEHSAADSFSASGQEVTLLKESQLGPYEYVSYITLSDVGLREEVIFKVVEDVSEVDILYPFTHCLSKSFIDWVTGSEGGISAIGVFLNDDSFTNLGRLKWMAMFSPDKGGYGAVISYAENYEGTAATTHRFRNNVSDSKLYFWPAVPFTGEVRFVCHVAGFKAPVDTWTQIAEAVEAQLTKLP